MKIQVTAKSVYGKILFYPVCENAKIFCRLAGRDTITRGMALDIKKLGYTIEAVAPELGAKL
jgi:hypothetical protein